MAKEPSPPRLSCKPAVIRGRGRLPVACAGVGA